MIMNSGHCFVTVCLLVSSVLAQSEQSKLEASIPPARLQDLVSSREQAQEALRRSGRDALSPEILRAFLEPGGSIAIAKMEQVVTTDRMKFTLTLAVEKGLRGTTPQQVPVECYWSDRPWPLRPPQGIRDKNVAVGDLAFQHLATLDFHKKENAGYCEEIVPALRWVDRYPFGGEHWIGGTLNGASTCVGPAHK
jgi:hypothetical protein